MSLSDNSGIKTNRPEALINAAIKGDKEKIEKLLADKDIDLNYKDKDHNTALMWAVRLEYDEITEKLIEAGAALEEKDNTGNTALLIAAYHGQISGAEILIKAGADFNAKDNSGQSALDYVQFGGRTTPQQKDEITKMLRDAGAK